MASRRLAGRRGRARVGVIVVIDEELKAARKILPANVNLVGTSYYVAEERSDHTYDVVLTKCSGRSNVPSSQAAAAIMEDYRPSVLLLVGIAGGIRGRAGVRLGDVVIGDFVEYYEYGKLVGGRYIQRREPYDHPSAYLRECIADPRREDGNWREWTALVTAPPLTRVPQAIVDNIVCGEKVLGDGSNKFQRDILRRFDKAVAVEMEAYGVARAVYLQRKSVDYNPQYLVIRGISDLVQSRSNQRTRNRWKLFAAAAAAAFARAVIEALPEDI